MLAQVPHDKGRLRSILTSEALAWNNLAKQIRTLANPIDFKFNLKLYLIGKIEMSVCSLKSCQDHPADDP